MNKSRITHRHLRKVIEEIHESEIAASDVLNRLAAELLHSNLIAAGQIHDGIFDIDLFEANCETFAMLFTDMDEFRKFSLADEYECMEHEFRFYMDTIENLGFDGYVINCQTEKFILHRIIIESLMECSQINYPHYNAYGPERLRKLFNQISNAKLESFIGNPESVGDYPYLVTIMCESILLTVVVSEDDLSAFGKNGIVNVIESRADYGLYCDCIGGEYLTVFTSAERIEMLDISKRKYPQIINLAMFVDYLLSADMDGIIINPGSDNLLMTRDVLLDYSLAIETHANYSSLNRSAYYVFLMDE